MSLLSSEIKRGPQGKGNLVRGGIKRDDSEKNHLFFIPQTVPAGRFEERFPCPSTRIICLHPEISE